MRIALTGDIFLTRRMNAALDSGALAPLGAEFRSCQAVVGNLETLFHEYQYPASGVSGGTWAQCDPAAAADLARAGFNLLARANNHGLDYGIGALQQTSHTLDSHGLGHAGTGRNLDDALAPAFLDTPDGRVALLSVSTTLPAGSPATRSRHGIPGRPGIAPLRYGSAYTIPAAEFTALRRVVERCYLGDPGDDRVSLRSLVFDLGTAFAVHSFPDEEDLAAVTSAVRDAREHANIVIVSIHSQETENDLHTPPSFLRAAAHQIAEAGADVVHGHGPHLLRGIELHKNVPILYSLGSIIFQNDTVTRQPDDERRALGLPIGCSVGDMQARKFDFSTNPEFWETVVVTVSWRPTGTIALRATPLVVARHGCMSMRGLPTPPDADRSARILDRLSHLSGRLGTTLRIDDGAALLMFTRAARRSRG